MSKVFDVIIIGGGIMGCSSALELARRGFKVAVVEKETIGKGPTGKSSAIIRQHYSNKLTAHMALYSLGVFQDFEERVGGECGFTQTGFIAVVEDKDLAGLEANIALQREVGIKTALIEAKDFRELMPGVETGDLIAVAYEPESGYADPYLTVTSYAQAARRHGATFFLDTEVTGLKFSSSRIAGVRTTSHDLDAPVIINCAGAWGAAVARMAQIDVPIDSCRAQVAFFRRPLGSESPHPVVGDFINATYFRSETGGITLIGLIDPSEAKAIVDPDAFAEYSDDEFILEAGERLVKRYPVMEHSQSTGGYASLYAITPDWHPIIDQVPGDSGFYICSGFSGHGFKLGPAVGLMVADLVSGNSDPLFDPTMFGFGRFADDKLIRGQYDYSIVG